MVMNLFPVTCCLVFISTIQVVLTAELTIFEFLGSKHQIQEKLKSSEKFLEYSIFQGQSALRNFPSSSKVLSDDSLSKASKALLLLCAGYGDEAHEVLLGVTPDSLEEAEYAATHPGQTSWMDDHPLEDIDDWVHSILHRIEGNAIGEGGHSGFENAKFWAAGGPKTYQLLTNNAWKKALCEVASRKAPLAVARDIVTREDTSHQILSGGEKAPRTVTVPANCWDPIAYIDLCRECSKANTALQSELEWLHRVEIALLYLYEERRDAFSVEEVVELCCSLA